MRLRMPEGPIAEYTVSTCPEVVVADPVQSNITIKFTDRVVITILCVVTLAAAILLDVYIGFKCRAMPVAAAAQPVPPPPAIIPAPIDSDSDDEEEPEIQWIKPAYARVVPLTSSNTSKLRRRER